MERYNKTYFEKLALEKERSGLLEENNYLKYLLKQYLNGISVNAEVLDDDNPLFVINGILALNDYGFVRFKTKTLIGKTNAPISASVHNQITYVEGAHTTAARS
jgi:hypothetical protein